MAGYTLLLAALTALTGRVLAIPPHVPPSDIYSCQRLLHRGKKLTKLIPKSDVDPNPKRIASYFCA